MAKWSLFRGEEAEQSRVRLLIEVAVIVAVLAAVFVGAKAADEWRTHGCATDGCVY
jgi:hypothetical protein